MHKHMWLVATSLLVSAIAVQAETGGCERKEQHLKQQLEMAQQQGNSSKARGLERALSEVRTHCTDAGLASEQEQREEIAERQQELEQAQAQGDANKITKRERKLAEAEAELEQLLEQ